VYAETLHQISIDMNPNQYISLIQVVNKNKRNQVGRTTAVKKMTKGTGAVLKSAQSVLKHNTSIQGGNLFTQDFRNVDGKRSLVVKGSAILQEVRCPPRTQVDQTFYPVGMIPLHPMYFNCPRLMGLFSSYIRWKLLNFKVRYIPRCPTTVSGEIVMGMSSCIQDGGPSASSQLSTDQAVKAAIMDLPGSVVSHIGSVSPVCQASFLQALDWKFTCRDGTNVNAIYCGLFCAGIEGDFTDDAASTNGFSIANLRAGTLVLEYEIALHESASILGFSTQSAAPKDWNSASLAAGALLTPSLLTDTPYNSGTIGTMVFDNANGTHTQNLKFYGSSTTDATAVKNGQLVWTRQNDNGAGTKYVSLHESLAEAQQFTRPLKNASAGAIDTSTWSTFAFSTAKVLLPVAAKAALALL